VDIEPLYYMITRQYPLHRFFHTYIGVSIVIAGTVALLKTIIWYGKKASLPNSHGWQQVKLLQLLIGAMLGGYSHILLDSLMHADIRPLAPFSDSNQLLHILSLATLHWFCIGCAVFGLLVISLRKLFKV
jgi:membrane-bound metal-dependent hydrolase YbcI (DUF457 family)